MSEDMPPMPLELRPGSKYQLLSPVLPGTSPEAARTAVGIIIAVMVENRLVGHAEIIEAELEGDQVLLTCQLISLAVN